MEPSDQICIAEDRCSNEDEDKENSGTANFFISHSWDGGGSEDRGYDDQWDSLDHRPAYVRSVPLTMGPR